MLIFYLLSATLIQTIIFASFFILEANEDLDSLFSPTVQSFNERFLTLKFADHNTNLVIKNLIVDKA